jgi:hypothetical protein
MLTAADNRIGRSLTAGTPPPAIVDDLYWWALSRDPSASERAAAEQAMAVGDPRQGLEDVAWALLNSREFLFRP